MKFIKLFAVLVSALFLIACLVESKKLRESNSGSLEVIQLPAKAHRANATNSSIPKLFKIEDSSNNTVLNVPKNTTFYINVRANPSTGYELFLKNYDAIDKNYLKIDNLLLDPKTNYYISNKFTVEKSKNNTVLGKPGYYQFSLVALKDFSNIDLEFITIRGNDATTQKKTRVRLTTASSDVSPTILKQQSVFISGSWYCANYIFYALMTIFALL